MPKNLLLYFKKYLEIEKNVYSEKGKLNTFRQHVDAIFAFFSM